MHVEIRINGSDFEVIYLCEFWILKYSSFFTYSFFYCNFWQPEIVFGIYKFSNTSKMWNFLGKVFLVLVSHARRLHQLSTSLVVFQ